MSGWPLPEKLQKENKPLGKCELVSAIVATAEVGAGLKRKISARASYLGGRLTGGGSLVPEIS